MRNALRRIGAFIFIVTCLAFDAATCLLVLAIAWGVP